MKFVSWNVNGLRACIQKGFLDEFNRFNADFFCLQETKLSEGQLQLDLPGYEQYWCYAEKKGYSGTAIFTKHTPLSVSYGIGVPELDNEGRVITLEYREFYLLTCYTPNAQRELARIDHRMKWDEAFRTYLQKLDETKPVIICGDLNVAHKEIDLKNPSSNRNNAGFSDQERQSFQKTLDLGFTDTFRHLYPDATGCYSWWSYMFHARENNAGWRIDYFLGSDRLKAQIYRAQIHRDILGSDHCPVSLELDTLVNGGLWSPECGHASVTEPEPVHEVEPTPNVVAVPVSTTAKVVRTVCIVLAVLLAVGIGFWLFPQEKPKYIAPAPEFTVHVKYFPFSFAEVSTMPIPDPSLPDSMRFPYYDQWYWVEAGSRLYNGDIHLLITAPDHVTADGWRITLEEYAGELDDLYNAVDLNNGSAKNRSATVSRPTSALRSYQTVPYYLDAALTDFGGWLVYGALDSALPTDLKITLQHDEYESFSTDVTAIPYISLEDAQEYTSSELLAHICRHPSISESLTIYDPNVDIDVEQNITYTFVSSLYPVLQAFKDRDDAVETLMTVSIDDDTTINNILLSTEHFQYKMTPWQQANYLTGQYPTYPNEIVYPDYDFDLKPKSTQYLCDVMLLHFHMHDQIAQCASLEAACYVFEYHLRINPYLQEFMTREDARYHLETMIYENPTRPWAYFLDLYEIYSSDTEDMPEMIIPELPPVEIEPTESIPE